MSIPTLEPPPGGGMWLGSDLIDFVEAGFGIFEVLELRLLFFLLSCIAVIKMLLPNSPATMVAETMRRSSPGPHLC